MNIDAAADCTCPIYCNDHHIVCHSYHTGYYETYRHHHTGERHQTLDDFDRIGVGPFDSRKTHIQDRVDRSQHLHTRKDTRHANLEPDASAGIAVAVADLQVQD